MYLIEIIEIPFMQRALIGSILLAVILGFFGVFMVPRKLSFMADGIAHASLFGIAVGLLVGGMPLLWAIGLSLILGTLLAKISDNDSIPMDAVIGICLVGGMSGALITMTFIPGYKPELFSYLFGSILSIEWNDIYILSALTAVTLILFKVQWRTLVITTIHNDLSKVLGLKATAAKYFLFIGTSIALIGGVKLLGVILISALLVIPYSSASLIGKSLRSCVILTQIIAVAGTITGIFISYIFDFPTGPAIGLLLVAIYLLAFTYSKIRSQPIWKSNHTPLD